MGRRLAGALALVLGVVAFAGPAIAGNGNGNGNGGGNGNNKADTSASFAASAPGNSTAAPGQLKKDAAASSQTNATAAPAVSSAPGSSQGIKPANDTAHDTHEAAPSTKTKLYGNGKTAGGIAIRNGASPSTVLHGPGNSQPHKAAPCSGGHEVDVHALKSKLHGKSCGSVSPPPGPVTHGEEHKGSDPGSSSTTTTPAGRPAAPSSSHSKPKPARSPKSVTRESGPALTAKQQPAAATLPFTGFPLWAGVALGIGLLGLGLALSLLAGRETKREVGP